MNSYRWVLFSNGLLAIGIILTGCGKTVPPSTTDKDPSQAMRDLGETTLGKMAAALAADKPSGDSGFLLLDRGNEALAWRLFMAESAERTIDAQYFLWKDDRAGRLFLGALMDAAERGVRVRVMIDDSMTESDPQYLAKFGSHPNIQLRLYKPIGPAHKSFVFRWVDFLADFRLLNRRMHNKLYIADDSLMIAGGRNIGEDYFEYLAPNVFRCRDLLGAGKIADEGSTAFDLYWNSAWTVPVEQIVDPVPTAADGQEFKKELDQQASHPSNYPPGFVAVGNARQAGQRLAGSLMWGPSRLVYDTVPGEDGEPRVPKDESDQVGQALRALASQTRQEIIIESAYLILTPDTMQHMRQLQERGLQLQFLTNSLAANNHTTAFVGYRQQRKQQMQVASALYEYRPDAESQTRLYQECAPGKPVPHLGLHAKTSVYDRENVFVGSFNLDPRSQNLNTEIGILVKCPELGAAVADSILNDMAPGNSWLLRLNDRGNTEWVTMRDGVATVEPDSEPLSSTARKLEADAAQPLTPADEM